MSNAKRIYPSRYSKDKLVTAAQYITELICEKKAKLDGKDLPQKFWELPQWSSFFRQQIFVANGLLRVYSAKAIVRALRLPQANKIYSLRAPQLDAMIVAEELKINTSTQQVTKRVEVDTLAKPRQVPIKETNLSKLRRLDE